MRVLMIILPLFALVSLFPQEDRGAAAQKQVPKEVCELVGTFTGTWTTYGANDKGEIVEKMSWTDTMHASNPQRNGNRAFVSTIDEMKFSDSKNPPMKIPGREGYFLNQDGSLGDYYIEMFGQTYTMVKLAGNVSAYAVQAAPQELIQLGFANVSSAQHVLVKVVTVEQEKETHRISRITTVHWTDKVGKEQWRQFISLKGFHQRQS